MTPWNIVAMAKLKGLDVIAVTDHNTAGNLPEVMAAGQALGVAVVPGIEVASKEEVHMLAYFETLESALAFGALVQAHLPPLKNRPALFGRQILMGEGDAETGELEQLLISATDLPMEWLRKAIEQHGGMAVPAHINRGNNGMLGALGMMPELPCYPVVELYPGVDCPKAATEGRFVLRSSDAHRLGDISERDFYWEGTEKTAKEVLQLLRNEAAGRMQAEGV